MQDKSIIEGLINDLSLLQNNKFSVKQTRRMYQGIVFELIQNKHIFEKNNDLRIFVEFVFKKTYREYLFSSRSLLAARVLKDLSFLPTNEDKINNKKISFEKDARILEAIKSTEYFLSSLDIIKEYSENIKRNNSNSIQAKEIIAWMKFINKKDN